MNIINALQGRKVRFFTSVPFHRSWAALGALVLAPGLALGATIHDESLDGDLNDTGLAPSELSFAIGSNEVLGATGRDSAGVAERDYFSFVVPAGAQLVAVNMLPSTPGDVGFMAIQSGPQVTLAVNPPDATGLLGWVHYESGQIGTDLLDDMGASGGGATGFVPPLGPGTYSVWVQDTNVGEFTYGFDFVLEGVAVPDGGGGLTVIALASLAAASLRRRR